MCFVLPVAETNNDDPFYSVPTFFWGEATSPGRLQGIADRLILTGDWRDADRSQINEETDAVVELEWE